MTGALMQMSSASGPTTDGVNSSTDEANPTTDGANPTTDGVNSRTGGVDARSDSVKIVINVEKVACDTLAIDINVLTANTNIAAASINVVATQIDGPEAPSYLGETCFGGPEAGSNTANSAADGRGWQCDIVEIDFYGPEMDIDMPRTRSNVA